MPPSGQGQLFAAAPILPEGFDYRDEIVAPGEEATLVRRIETLDFRPYEFRGYSAKRRVVAFGRHYQWSAQRPAADAEPIPDFLLAVREQAAAFASVPADRFEQILINEYTPGAGIGWHRDRPVYGDVVGVSLGAPCTLRFRRQRGEGWERAAQIVRPRSAYLLRGAARSEWEHSIPELDALRYSVTFRNFAAAI